MSERRCGDCGAKPGELHVEGCDVERCCLCGGQAISCDCVYRVSGMDPDTLDRTHPDIYRNGPTPELEARLAQEEEKFGGRLPWTGEWPTDAACREFDLWCYWADARTGEPIEWPSKGEWRRCTKDHPHACADPNRLPLVARWDREQRRWVKR